MNDNDQRRILIALTVVLVGALLLLATALGNVELRGGQGAPPSLFEFVESMTEQDEVALPAVQFPGFWLIVRIVVWVVGAVSVIAALTSPKYRRGTWSAITVLSLLIVGLWWARRIGRPRTPEELPQVPVIQDDAVLLADTIRATEPPQWVTAVAAVLFGLVVTLIAYALWRRFRPQPATTAPLNTLSLQAHEAIERLRKGGNFSDVIIQCYNDMAETLAQQHGIERASGLTPREFEAQLVDLGVPATPVGRLTRLFEQVRYGEYTPNTRDEVEAVDSLRAIVRALDKLHAADEARQAAAGGKPASRPQRNPIEERVLGGPR